MIEMESFISTRKRSRSLPTSPFSPGLSSDRRARLGGGFSQTNSARPTGLSYARGFFVKAIISLRLNRHLRPTLKP
jgi:hypothetical protein